MESIFVCGKHILNLYFNKCSPFNLFIIYDYFNPLNMSKINPALLKSKFRGCILGSLVGDCFGAPFAGDSLTTTSKIVLQRYFDKLDGPHFKAPVKKCTKDSIMAKCVAQTLIDDSKALDPTKLAKLFVKEYFHDPKRGYGEGTINIFHKLRVNKFREPFKPALEQTGQNDNGACMRVSPISLFYYDNYKEMINAATTSAEITHNNKQGLTGALLNSIAVQQSLLSDPTKMLDVEKYTSNIIGKLSAIEKDDEGLGIGHPQPFSNQMEVVRELLRSDANDEEVVENLGHSMLAIYSVPTAIYCFLRAQTDIKNIETSNPFRRTLQYAISLGGDTATITAIAGSIAGAFYGEEKISKSMVKHCEDNEVFLHLADKLYNLKFNITT